MKPVVIIAEAGVNHNGNIEAACRLVDAAAESGADYIKFQTFKASQFVTKAAEKADYQKSRTDRDESQFEMISRLELSREDHQVLVEHCRQAGVKFFSTAFDHGSLELLNDIGMDFLKVPSGEITNVPYLRRIGQTGRPVLLSTGMTTLSEIEMAIEILEASGTPRDLVTVLHCNTEYPTPMQHVNLRAMITIRDAFKVNVGYSDHTLGIEIPIAAVALGACVIEKHLTLDRSLPGPDHAASLEPDEFQQMVEAIRNIELALGDGIKRPSRGELRNRDIARKSIVAAKSIKKGEMFSESNLTVKRPGTGMSPQSWDACLGRIARRDFALDEQIEW